MLRFLQNNRYFTSSGLICEPQFKQMTWFSDTGFSQKRHLTIKSYREKLVYNFTPILDLQRSHFKRGGPSLIRALILFKSGVIQFDSIHHVAPASA